MRRRWAPEQELAVRQAAKAIDGDAANLHGAPKKKLEGAASWSGCAGGAGGGADWSAGLMWTIADLMMICSGDRSM